MRKGNVLLVVLILVGILIASVGGYFWWKSKNPAPVIKSVETKQVDETTNWKTYVDKNNQYSFKYPDDTNQIQEADSTVRLIHRRITYIFEVVYYSTNDDLKVWFANAPAKGYLTKNGWISTNITFNGKTALFLKPQFEMQVPSNIYLVKTDGAIYQITVAQDKIADQILSTFKFLDQTEVSCNSDGDCQSGFYCTVVGPLITNQPIYKTCVQKGAVTPL